MPLFVTGHATHPHWRVACDMVLAQLREQLAQPDHISTPTLGLVYLTDAYAAHAQGLMAQLSASLPQVIAWAGASGVGVCADSVEYRDEPALSVMLCDVPAHQFRVFSGIAPLAAEHGFEPHTALVHADAQLHDLPDMLSELAQRTASGNLWGGLSGSRHGQAVQLAQSSRKPSLRTASVFHGGLSGVAFSADVGLRTCLAQGCLPIARERAVTAATDHLLLSLDGQPALRCLLGDLGLSAGNLPAALQGVRQTQVALSAFGGSGVRPTGDLGPDVWVRPILGMDAINGSLALPEAVTPGLRVTFCQRDARAARLNLMRVCTEIRDELETAHTPTHRTALAAHQGPDTRPPTTAQHIRGAIYIGCAGRGSDYFGESGAEMTLVRRALGKVPLIGFFSESEIAGRHLHGFSSVLMVFI